MKFVDDLEFQPKKRKLKGKSILRTLESLCVGAGVLREIQFRPRLETGNAFCLWGFVV